MGEMYVNYQQGSATHQIQRGHCSLTCPTGHQEAAVQGIVLDGRSGGDYYLADVPGLRHLAERGCDRLDSMVDCLQGPQLAVCDVGRDAHERIVHSIV